MKIKKFEIIISKENALEILELLGRDEYDNCSDYYIATDGNGDEYLMKWRFDKPLAKNSSNAIWIIN